MPATTLAEALAAAGSSAEEVVTEREPIQAISIICSKGTLDMAYPGLILANAARMSGIEATLFFTFWGLKAIQKGNTTGKGLFGRMLGVMNRGGIDRIGPSRFNFGGMGRWMFKKMMGVQNVATLPEMLQMAIDLDVKLLACEMSRDVMGISDEELMDGLEPAGVASFLGESLTSRTNLFI